MTLSLDSRAASLRVAACALLLCAAACGGAEDSGSASQAVKGGKGKDAGAEPADPAAPGGAETDFQCSDWNTGPLPPNCTKIEGGDIGKVGVTLEVNGVTVEITRWIAKGGGDSVGFDYVSSSDDVCLSVKAGTGRHEVEGADSWRHPAGLTGSGAKGISNIVMCVLPPGDGGGSDGGDGTGGSGGNGTGGAGGNGSGGELA
jgi:hypothetical protein